MLEPLSHRFSCTCRKGAFPWQQDAGTGNQKRVQEAVHLGKGLHGLFPLKTRITYAFPFHITVFLFNEAVVIFMVGTASGELDIVTNAPIKKLVIDELTAVVAINAE